MIRSAVYGSGESKADRIEVELIRSLFESVLPSFLMSVGFAVSGALMVRASGDPVLLVLLVLGCIASVVRIAITCHGARVVAKTDIRLMQARRMEGRLAPPYVAFAVMLGLFGGRALTLPFPDIAMLTMVLLVGYAAGVAAGIGLRPRLAISSMTIAVAPAIVAALLRPDPIHWAAGAMTLVFLVGGTQSVRKRHAWAVDEIDRRITFSMLARQDALTDLPNRLALRECFGARTGRTAQGMVAVHCLDLNGFKPVNDTHGHPVGDALLTEVAQRLKDSVRAGDIAARLGGDEFVVVQFGLAREEDATMLAARLADAIGRPYRLGALDVRISTCVGYVVTPEPLELDEMLRLADEALYAGKHGGRRPVTRHPLGTMTLELAA